MPDTLPIEGSHISDRIQQIDQGNLAIGPDQIHLLKEIETDVEICNLAQ